MLIHPWDAAKDDAEWRDWLAGHDFGQLIAGGTGRDLPMVTPAHFAYDGDRTIVTHLARPNPIWPLLEEHPRALLTVVDDYTYIRADWNTASGADPARGVPTSYYATVQLEGDVRLVDDPAAKASLLDKQLRHFETDGARAPVSATDAPTGGCCPGSAGSSSRSRASGRSSSSAETGRKRTASGSAPNWRSGTDGWTRKR